MHWSRGLGYLKYKLQFTSYQAIFPFTLLLLSLFISVKDNFILPVTQANNLKSLFLLLTLYIKAVSLSSVGSTSKYIQTLSLVALSHHISWFIATPSLLASLVPPYSLFSTGQPEHLLKHKSVSACPSSAQNLPKTSSYSQQSQTLCWLLRPFLPSLPSPLTLSPLTPLQPHWPPASQLCHSTLSSIWSLYLQSSPLEHSFPCLAGSLPFFRIKCHFLKEAFPKATLFPQPCHSLTLLYRPDFITSRLAIYSLLSVSSQ